MQLSRLGGPVAIVRVASLATANRPFQIIDNPIFRRRARERLAGSGDALGGMMDKSPQWRRLEWG